MKHIIATLTLFIFLTRARTVKRFDDLIDDNVFLSFSAPESSDDLFDLFTEEPIASVPQSCHAESGVDNLFSSDIARVRPREDIDECLPPLPPNIVNLYDSTQILNMLSGGDDTLTGIPGTDSPAAQEKSDVFPGANTDTTDTEQ